MSSLNLWLRDAGTRLRTQPADIGMDRAWWAELDFEEAVAEDRISEINGAMTRDMDGGTIRPWPLWIPPRLPLDTHESLDGLNLRLLQRARYAKDSWGVSPVGSLRWRETWAARNRDEGLSTDLSLSEMRDREPGDRTRWLRVPHLNERTGELLAPVRIPLRGLRGEQYLELEDNDLYTPFDLSREEDYYLAGKNGVVTDPGLPWVRAALRDRWRVAVYLRPRRWRLLIEVLAHFLITTGFELAQHDQWYLRAYFDRPPVYPYRNDVRHTSSDASMWHPYEGAYLNFDHAVEWAVSHSKAAAYLRREIYADQWWGLCIAWTLWYVEPGATTIWTMPPRAGEVICGLGVELMPGREELLWVVAKRGREDLYPQRLLGQWWTDFFYAGGGA